MSEADKVQFGGNHYKGKGYEHWNFVADLNLNYFQACSTKYVTRHGSKNGREDVQKAGHYVTKWIELIESHRMPAPIVLPANGLRGARIAAIDLFCTTNGMAFGSDEFRFTHAIAGAFSMEDLVLGTGLIAQMLKTYDEKPKLPPKAKILGGPIPSHVAAVMEPQFGTEGWWGDLTVLWKCHECGEYFKAAEGVLPSTAHPACRHERATAAYVDQARDAG